MTDWTWSWIGTAGAVAGATGYAMALLVLLAGPGRRQNRRLSFILFLESSTAVFGGGLVYFVTSRSLAFGAQSVGFLAFGVMVLAYPFFLSTLPSPLARPLRRRWVDVALVAAMLGFTAFYLERTELFLAGVGPAAYARYVGIPGPLGLVGLILPSLAVFLYGLACAVTMWRAAPAGSMARRQGRTYTLAFGIRDLAWMVFLLGGFVWRADHAFSVLLNVALIAFYLILAYGMLKTQLLDIDLHIKWTIRKGTLLAMFLAVFLVTTVMAENFLTSRYGWVAGGFAAGLLLFALTPLQRMAERVADAAMPRVQATPEYVVFRKFEVYKATLEELARGGLTAKEKKALAALQAKLGISATDARQIQRDVFAEASSPT